MRFPKGGWIWNRWRIWRTTRRCPGWWNCVAWGAGPPNTPCSVGMGRIDLFPGDDIGARNNLERGCACAGPLDYDPRCACPPQMEAIWRAGLLSICCWTALRRLGLRLEPTLHRGIEMIKLKRVYDKRSSADGKHYLVERLWPRGIKKDDFTPGWLVQRCRAKHRTAKVVQSRPREVGGVPSQVFCRARSRARKPGSRIRQAARKAR